MPSSPRSTLHFLTNNIHNNEKIFSNERPKVISPKITEIQNQKARVKLRNNAAAKTYREKHASKLARETNIDDRKSMIAMVLADKDIPSAIDIDAQLVTAALEWEATEAADRSLDAPLAAAKREAADSILDGLKKEHDVLVNRIVSGLADVVAPAWAELFDLSRQLKDKDVGWCKGICETMPLDLFGPPNAYSPLANFLRAAVAAGYLNTLPKVFRA